ncbi:MAG: TPM domain-containing protein [Pyrinomonadaceae bacterium]|nr:TPM domain-containing protein [Pyrinomonadaceae bacterium]
MKKSFFSIFFTLILSVSGLAQAKVQTSLAPNGFLNDFANVFDLRTRLDLEQTLQKISKEEGLNIAVVTVKTTGNISAKDYSLSLARNWKLGEKTKPNYSMLILAAIDDRQYFTQISRDLEDVTLNSWLDSEQKRLLVPAFQKREYAFGLEGFIDSCVKKFIDFKQQKRAELERKFRIFEPAAVLENSLQAVVVAADGWDSSNGTAQLFERPNANSGWAEKGKQFPVVLGRSGLAWDEQIAYLLKDPHKIFKQEGDGRAPAGVFDLKFAFGSVEKPANSKLSFVKVEEYTECVDDVNSASYNRIVDRMKIGNFDWQSSEKMLEIGEEYALGVFVDYNSQPVKKGNGSCIFLHIWTDKSTATSGCTAMARENLENIVNWIDPSKKPVLIQIPRTEYQKMEQEWKFPNLR